MVHTCPLTGRGDELRLIADALDGNTFRGVVIAGRAGVGKTRLAGDAVSAATIARGWRVRATAGTASGRAVPLGALAQWTTACGGPTAGMAERVIDTMTAGAGGSPILLSVDDAHLLDDASASVVRHLLLRGLAMAVLTVRSGEPAPDAVIGLWQDELLSRLELQPLSRQDSDELLRSMLGEATAEDCRHRLWEKTLGNAMLLRHLVHEERANGRLVESDGEWQWFAAPTVSPSLHDLVMLQIGAPPGAVRDVAELVAAAESISRDCLETLAAPAAIAEAERRGLVSTSAPDGDVRVANPLYGETLLARSGPLRQRRLRGYVAAALTRAGVPVDPIRLGLLWLDSDLPPDPELLADAADAAAGRLDIELAERCARAAVDAGGGRRAKLTHAYALHILGQGDAAQDVLDTLDANDSQTTSFIDETWLRASNLLWPLRNPDESWRVIDTALETAWGARVHRLRTFRALQLAIAGRPAQVSAVMDTVDRDRLDRTALITGLCAETLAAADLGRTSEAVKLAVEGYDLINESPHEAFHTISLAESHAFALVAAGCLHDASAAVEQYRQRCANLLESTGSLVSAVIGMVALKKGDLTTAMRCLDPGEGGFGEYAERSGVAYRYGIYYTEAVARTGDVGAATTSLAFVQVARHPGQLHVDTTYLLAKAWVQAGQGDANTALRTALRAAACARERGQLAREVVCLQTAVQFGDASATERLTDLAALVEGPRASAAAQYSHALAARDGAGLDAVSRHFEDMGDLLAAADAAAQAAVAHRAANRRGSALTASSRATRLARECGDATSPALVAARVILPFTRRERETAILASRGMTNREIAGVLSLSVRTVEGHIFHASTKAGATTRAELAALVRQFGMRSLYS